MSTPPRSAGSSAPRCALSQMKYSRAASSSMWAVSQRGLPWKSTGAIVAERAARAAADRQNLLRVMPAKGIDSTPTSGFDVAVIGGGISGLSVAWRARARGLSVVVLDRGQFGAGTSRVAAGMLAPASEADAQERALLALNLESARLWGPFAEELQDVTGLDVGMRTA